MVIDVYDRNGNHLGRMGGQGRGPGEHNAFGHNDMVLLGDYLLTYDVQLQRINRFSTETLEPEGAILMDPSEWTQSTKNEGIYPGITHIRAPMYYPWGDSLFLMRFTDVIPMDEISGGNRTGFRAKETYSRYYTIDLEGNVVSDSLFTHTNIIQGFRGGISLGRVLPLNNKSIMAVSDDRRIYSARAHHFLIKVYDSNGRYERAIFYPFPKAPADPDDFIPTYAGDADAVAEALKNSNLPGTWPAIEHMMVDDRNRIWVSTYMDDNEHFRWLVLDPEGQLLATFQWPGQRYARRDRRGIRAIRDGLLYAYEESTGDENQIPAGRLVRYRIEMTRQQAGGQ